MAQGPDGSGEVVVHFPLWTLVDWPEFERVGYPEAATFCHSLSHRKAMPLFSTEQGALLWLAMMKRPDQDIRAVAVPDVGSLSELAVHYATEQGVTHAAYDPAADVSHPARAYFPLSELAAGGRPVDLG